MQKLAVTSLVPTVSASLGPTVTLRSSSNETATGSSGPSSGAGDIDGSLISYATDFVSLLAACCIRTFDPTNNHQRVSMVRCEVTPPHTHTHKIRGNILSLTHLPLSFWTPLTSLPPSLDTPHLTCPNLILTLIRKTKCQQLIPLEAVI